MKFLSFLSVLFMSSAAFALSVGQKAPMFPVLEAYKGKTVVLEWTNHECPFVKKHYDSGAMQALQKEMFAKDVVWLSIISSAPGKQGFVDAQEAMKIKMERNAMPAQIVLDASGKIGRLYGAKTTPHMFIIDKEGILRYMGAIDDKVSTDLKDMETAKNYVRQALDELAEGKPVTVESTTAYGCSIKY